MVCGIDDDRRDCAGFEIIERDEVEVAGDWEV